MHHKFRHVLQHKTTSTDYFIKIRAMMDENLDVRIENSKGCALNNINTLEWCKEAYKKAVKDFKENGFPKTKEMEECYAHIKKNSAIDNVFTFPDKYSEWVKKNIDTYFLTEYVCPTTSYKKYYEQFVEKDARFAGESISKLFNM